MIALAVLALLVGAAAGVILMGPVRGGKREDECQACRRRELDAAFRAADGKDDPEWRDGNE